MKKNSKFIKLFLKTVLFFFFFIILLELLLSFQYVNYISKTIEDRRKLEFSKSWNAFLEQKTKQIDSMLYGYAWWDYFSAMFTQKSYKEIKTMLENDSIVSNYDFFMVGNIQDQFFLHSSNGDFTMQSLENANSPKNITMLQYLENYSTEKFNHYKHFNPDQIKKDNSDKMSEFFFTSIAGKIRLIGLSPICNEKGYPTSNSFIIFGINLENILLDAEKIIPAQLRLAKTKIKSPYLQIELCNKFGSQKTYLEIEPHFQIEGITTKSLFVFLLFQICLVFIAIIVLYFMFTKRYANHLKEIIRKREKELENANNELIALAKKNAALATIVTANHELNQPLTILKCNFEMFKMQLPNLNLLDKQEKYLKKIEESLNRIQSILEKYRNSDSVHFTAYTEETEMTVFEDKHNE